MQKLYVILLISLQLFQLACQAQTPGCTDPLANNYDPSATHNDGSCTYESEFVSSSITTPIHSVLSETSGLILWDDYVWTHNDDADTQLYGLDTLSGELLIERPLPGVENIDWEEISQDDKYIYVGDFGNNRSGNRTDLHILRIEKSSFNSGDIKIDTIWFSYSDQTDLTPQEPNYTDFDCEAMIVSVDSIYLFSKQWISGGSSAYSLPKYPGTHKALSKSSYNIHGLVTGACYLEAKQLVVLTGYSSALIPFFYLMYDFPGKDFFEGNKRKVYMALPIHQIEGIATDNGLKYYVSNEYSLLQPWPVQVQKLHTFDLSAFLNGYLSGLTSVENLNTGRGHYKLHPNPASNEVLIKSKDFQNPTSYVVYDLSARPVGDGELTGPKTRVDISHLNSGMYIVRIADQGNTSLKLIKK